MRALTQLTGQHVLWTWTPSSTATTSCSTHSAASTPTEDSPGAYQVVKWFPIRLDQFCSLLLQIGQGIFISRNFQWNIRHRVMLRYPSVPLIVLTHWGRVTHICVSKLTIISSDNDLSPNRRQAIIWTNAGILLIGPLGTNFGEIWIEIQIFSFRKMHWKMSSAKWRPFCLGLNVLNSVLAWEITRVSLHKIWKSLRWWNHRRNLFNSRMSLNSWSVFQIPLWQKLQCLLIYKISRRCGNFNPYYRRGVIQFLLELEWLCISCLSIRSLKFLQWLPNQWRPCCHYSDVIWAP